VTKQYTPDRWVICKTGRYYYLFTGWSGSYLYGASWRRSTYITGVRFIDGAYYFSCFSGSLYQCHGNAYGILGSLAPLITNRTDIEILPESTNWLELDWNLVESNQT
jgi:hypothetical protein